MEGELMKKIKSLRIASILLVATLLSMCLLGGTFAKYTTATSGSDVVNVAKWSIRVNKEEIAVSPQRTYDFDLFKLIKDANGTSDETDVVDGLIAPGTSGEFTMTVKNTSEVSAKYSIILSDTNKSSIPIQYSLNGTDWTDSLSKLAEDNLTDITLAAQSETATHTLYWRWAFDNETEGALNTQTDASDSELGNPFNTTIPSVTVSATITASQVD